MSVPLLTTKLYIPPLRPELVPRPRLTRRLNENIRRKLTVISAPAGYGKTTLVSAWVDDSGLPVAWVSLDENDNDLGRFLTYVVAALQQIEPNLGETVLMMLRSPQPPSLETILTVLINELTSISQRFGLVLDDYHVISATPVHDGLAFLLDHQPPQMHLVIAGRTDPALSLARLRAQGQVTEIRSEDLRFTVEETATFLNQRMGLEISPQDVATLEARTEGWIAGLQLAAISMRRREDRAGFVEAFAGSHRFVIDYLVEEVLSQQSFEIREFMLKTSVLRRLSAPLCSTVTGHEDSQAILTQLEQANLFTVPLDDERRWYRYHRLFADFLRQRLEVDHSEWIPDLYHRASAWFGAQGEVENAIQYALEGRDEVRAASLLDGIALELIKNSEIGKLLHLISLLPEEVRRDHARLCAAHAWALNFTRQFDSIGPLLAVAEEHLQHPESLPADFPPNQLSATTATVRAYAATWQGNYDEAIESSRAALEALSGTQTEEMRDLLATVTLNLGIAYSRSGRVVEGEEILVRAIRLNREFDNVFATLGAIGDLMRLRVATAQLGHAHSIGQQGLAWGREWSTAKGRSFPVEHEIHRELAGVCYEWNQLPETQVHTEQVQGLHESWGQWGWIRYYDQRFYLHQALGDLDTALECHQKIDEISAAHSFRRIRRIKAEGARRELLLWRTQSGATIWIDRASQWADAAGLQPERAFSYEQEYEYATLAHVLVAEGRTDQALALLEGLCRVAEVGARDGDLIGYGILRALALQSLDREEEALKALSETLTLAEPAGYVRSFVDAGQPMVELLGRAASRGMAETYVGRLLTAFGRSQVGDEGMPLRMPHIQPLVDPLSERELEIVRLMASGRSGPQIAEELVISINTVKTHVRNVYGKLGVNKRFEAIQRARELGLI